MGWQSWGDAYNSLVGRGYDHGYAAYRADEWEQRKMKQAEKTKDEQIAALTKALEFYANHIHWMGLTEDDTCPKLLIANGSSEVDGTEGWAVAEHALSQMP